MGSSAQKAVTQLGALGPTRRDRIRDVLSDDPGLESRLGEAVERGYKYARTGTLEETRLDDDALPQACPYTFDDMMTRPIVYEKPVKRRNR